MAELEKEVTRLRATERSLRDSVCNKLLLEEQVHSLSTRLEAMQPIQQELHDFKVFNCILIKILSKVILTSIILEFNFHYFQAINKKISLPL